MTTMSPTIAFERVTTEHELLDARADQVRFIDVPERRHFAVDGSGPPGGADFQAAFQALYPAAYTLHFALKRRGLAAPVGALEGLFWLAGSAIFDPAAFAVAGEAHEQLLWSLRLPVPAGAADSEIDAALADVARKKGAATIERLRVESWTEGPSAQILHVGPYSEEPPTIARLHEAIAARGLRPRGRHHEIYISDPNRTRPERVKTVIRQPVEPAR